MPEKKFSFIINLAYPLIPIKHYNLPSDTTMKKEDRLRQEASNACALCGYKEYKSLTTHHIDGDNTHTDYENEIILCYNCHSKHHQHPEYLTTEEIRDCKRQLILKTVTQYGLNALKLAKRQAEGFIAMPFLVWHLVDLGYIEPKEPHSSYGKVDISQRFILTAKGQNILALLES